MSVLILLAGTGDSALSIVVSPLAELSACLNVLTESDHHRGQAGWAANAIERAPGEFVDTMMRFSPLWMAYRARYFYIGCRGGGDSVESLDAELERLADQPVISFMQETAWACAGGNSRGTFDDLLSDAAQSDQLLAAAGALSGRRVELAERLLNDPESFRGELIAFLSECRQVFFDSTWESVLPALRQEQSHLREVLRKEGPAFGLARIGGNVSVQASPLRIHIEKNKSAILKPLKTGLVVLPSRHGRPHLLVKNEPGLIPLLQYPLYQEVRQTGEVTLARMRVLADPRRAMMCRLLSREPMSTSALAESCAMTVPQTSRHLQQLARLGLVKSSREGRYVYYSLELEVVQGLGTDFVTSMLA
jgi:DNA-binding transcriptional ArsR family regulator